VYNPEEARAIIATPTLIGGPSQQAVVEAAVPKEEPVMNAAAKRKRTAG
jgi:hypothetical protein